MLNAVNQGINQEENCLPRANCLLEMPKSCFHKCKNKTVRCFAAPNYSLDQLKTDNLVSILSLEEELHIHGHPKSLFNRDKKRQRNVMEGKQELISHYRYAHGVILNTNVRKIKNV